MDLFDIIGPIMVGPSSSHTAGAVRIGRLTRALLGSEPVHAELLLHGSFAATGQGHGTDRALIAGLLGMEPDDARIPQSFSLARQRGLTFQFRHGVLQYAHPNSVQITVQDAAGTDLTVVAASLGGGRVKFTSVDGLPAAFSGERNTLIIRNQDRVGEVAAMANALSETGVNIAAMQLYRDAKGGQALMVVESDEAISPATLERLRGEEGIQRVTYLPMGGDC